MQTAASVVIGIGAAGLGVYVLSNERSKNEQVYNDHMEYLDAKLRGVSQDENGEHLSMQIGDATRALKRWSKLGWFAQATTSPDCFYIGEDAQQSSEEDDDDESDNTDSDSGDDDNDSGADDNNNSEESLDPDVANQSQ